MGLFDKLKNMETDEDDAIALGVATGMIPEVWLDDDGAVPTGGRPRPNPTLARDRAKGDHD
jgi:hypothetical protein